MSFLDVLKTIGKDIGIGINFISPLAPTIGKLLPPGASSIFGLIFNTIITVEGLIAQSGTGAVKKSVTMSIIKANQPGVDEDLVGNLIDELVKILNLLAKLHLGNLDWIGKLPTTGN